MVVGCRVKGGREMVVRTRGVEGQTAWISRVRRMKNREKKRGAE